MLALIPYFSLPVLEWGALFLDSWAALVSLGFIAGLELARARGVGRGLDVRDVVDGIVVIVGTGFIVAHLVHVLAYNPHLIEEEGWITLLEIWGGFSSTGGFIGAVLGALLFYKVIRPRPFWVHADTVMWGFPFGWALGRIGCFTAHDHVGARSDSLLAVDFADRFYIARGVVDQALWGPRHDLGLYEALWTIGIAAVFWALRKRPVRPGFFTALFATLYAPIRFILDFLRNNDLPGADVRWAGLTPAQWGAVAMFCAGVAMLVVLRRRPGAEP